MRRVTSDRFSDGKALMTDWIPGGDAVIKGGAILEVHIEREGMNKKDHERPEDGGMQEGRSSHLFIHR